MMIYIYTINKTVWVKELKPRLLKTRNVPFKVNPLQSVMLPTIIIFFSLFKYFSMHGDKSFLLHLNIKVTY